MVCASCDVITHHHDNKHVICSQGDDHIMHLLENGSGARDTEYDMQLKQAKLISGVHASNIAQ